MVSTPQNECLLAEAALESVVAVAVLMPSLDQSATLMDLDHWFPFDGT